jgi:hypothetical protein
MIGIYHLEFAIIVQFVFIGIKESWFENNISLCRWQLFTAFGF